MERRTVGVLDIIGDTKAKDGQTLLSDSRVVGSYFASFGWTEYKIGLPLDLNKDTVEKIERSQLLVAANISLRGTEEVLELAQNLSIPVYSFQEREGLPSAGLFELHEATGPYGIHMVYYKYSTGLGLPEATATIMNEHFSTDAKNNGRGRVDTNYG